MDEVARLRAVRLAVAGALVLVAALVGGIVWADKSGDAAGTRCSDLGARNCVIALRVAHHQANSLATGRKPSAAQVDVWPASIRIVAASVWAGTIARPNVGRPCSSGRILSVQLIGTFDVLVSPGPEQAGHKPSTTVHGVRIEADRATGRACLLSVQTGHVDVPAGSSILYRRSP